MSPYDIKETLLNKCAQSVKDRLEKVHKTIASIVESLADASKSSAGDKHETSRAMLQIDRENAGKQLQELENLERLLPKININKTTDYARLGSLIHTNQGDFFISISLGAIIVKAKTYYCVALQAPIGKELSGKKEGDQFVFNNKEYLVLSVC